MYHRCAGETPDRGQTAAVSGSRCCTPFHRTPRRTTPAPLPCPSGRCSRRGAAELRVLAARFEQQPWHTAVPGPPTTLAGVRAAGGSPLSEGDLVKDGQDTAVRTRLSLSPSPRRVTQPAACATARGSPLRVTSRHIF